MKQLELTSKLLLVLIAIVAFSAMTVPPIVAQPGPPEGVGGGPPIPDNSVTSEKILDGEVQTEDLADGAVELTIHRVEGSEVTIPPGDFRASTAQCPSEEILTGGGFDKSTNVEVTQNGPGADGKTWFVGGFNLDQEPGSDGGLQASALCIDPTIP